MRNIPLAFVKKVSHIVLILGFVIMLIGCFLGSTQGIIVVILGLLVHVGNIIFIFVFSRCPHCGGFVKIYKHYCPHCGNYIEV